MEKVQAFAAQTLTDAGTVTLNPLHDVNENSSSAVIDGNVIFTATGTKATGTFSASAQLQGSIDGTNWVNIGSAVVMADTVKSAIPLGSNILYFKYYQVVITGSGTQSTEIVGSYGAKGRN